MVDNVYAKYRDPADPDPGDIHIDLMADSKIITMFKIAHLVTRGSPCLNIIVSTHNMIPYYSYHIVIYYKRV